MFLLLTEATLTTSRLSKFLHFLFCKSFFVLPNNLMVKDVCSSSLYLYFILNTNLLLILLLQIWIGELLLNISYFCDMLNLILNILHWIRTIWWFKLEWLKVVLNWSYVFKSLFLCSFLLFSLCKKHTSFEEKHIYWSFLSLIFVTSQKQIYLHYFFCLGVHEYCFHAYIWTIIVCSV